MQVSPQQNHVCLFPTMILTIGLLLPWQGAVHLQNWSLGTMAASLATVGGTSEAQLCLPAPTWALQAFPFSIVGNVQKGSLLSKAEDWGPEGVCQKKQPVGRCQGHHRGLCSFGQPSSLSDFSPSAAKAPSHDHLGDHFQRS